MRGKIVGGILLLGWLGTGGCITPREIAVEISSPPEIPLPDCAGKVALVFSVPPLITGGDTGDPLMTCDSMNGGPCLLAAGERSLIGCAERLFEESDKEIVKIIEWIDTCIIPENLPPPLFREEALRQICEAPDRSDLIINLASLRLQQKITFSAYKRWPHEARNKVWSKTILYRVEPEFMQQATLQVYTNALWRIYECKTKHLIFEGPFRDSVTYKVDGKTREEVKKKLPSLRTAAERVGYVQGWDFAGKLLPSSTTVLRHYYASRNRLLREATKNVLFREWQKAEENWEKALKETRGPLRAKILYNLALARERKGDYEKALEYIREAVAIYPTEAIKQYYGTLISEQRKRK